MRTGQFVPYFYDPTPGEGGGILSYEQVQAMMAEPAPQPPSEPESPAPQNETPAAPVDSPNPPAASETTPPPPPPVTSWKESVTDEELLGHVAEKFQKPALLKTLGVPEHLIGAFDKITPEIAKYAEYVASGGNPTEYLRIVNTDYKAMSELQLIELDLRERHPDLDQNKFQILLKSELKKYNLDRDDYAENSDEAVVGEIALKKDADKVRERYLQKQSELKAPALQPDTRAQEQAEKVKQITDTVRNSVAVKELQANKKLLFGVGADAFPLEIQDFDGIVNSIISASIEAGKPLADADAIRLAKTVTFHNNMDAIEKAWSAHMKAVVEAAIRKEDRNAAPPGTTPAPTNPQNKSAGNLLATEGQIMSYEQLFGG